MASFWGVWRNDGAGTERPHLDRRRTHRYAARHARQYATHHGIMRALASIDPEIGKAKIDLAAVWTNDFAKKANAKYPKP